MVICKAQDYPSLAAASPYRDVAACDSLCFSVACQTRRPTHFPATLALTLTCATPVPGATGFVEPDGLAITHGSRMQMGGLNLMLCALSLDTIFPFEGMRCYAVPHAMPTVPTQHQLEM